MDIIEMKAEHVQDIARLETLCFSDPWSANSIASELNNRFSYWLVAFEDGILVGYVGSQSVLDSADMMNLAVHPDFRKRGIGEKLVKTLCGALLQRDVRFLLLEVRVSNEPAISLYAKLGFVQVGLRRNYYHHPKEDALILRKELDA